MTAGYGDERVTIGRSMVGRVAVTKVAAVPALRPRIRVELSWTLGHRHSSREGQPQEKYQILDFGGELRVGADDLVVGTLVRDGSRHPLHSLGYVDTQAASVALDLGSRRLERLEECRAGGALTMEMRLWARVEMRRTEATSAARSCRRERPSASWKSR